MNFAEASYQKRYKQQVYHHKVVQLGELLVSISLEKNKLTSIQPHCPACGKVL